MRRLLLTVLVAAVAACDRAEPPTAPRERDVPQPTNETARYITIAPAKARIDTGQLLRLDAAAWDADWRLLQRVHIDWASSDTSIATAHGGTVHARTAGYVAITARSGSAVAQALVQVAVNGEYPHGVIIVPVVTTISACAAERLRAHTDPDIGDTRFGWASSDTTVLRVDAAGTIHGVAAGSADIAATWLPDPSRRAVRSVTVTPCVR